MNQSRRLTGSNGSERVQPTRKARDLVSSLLAILALGLLVGLIVWVVTQRMSDPWLTLVGFLAFVGVYPLTYVAYSELRAEAKRKRLEWDFDLLALKFKDQKVEEAVQLAFNTVYGPLQFIAFIALIILVSFILILGFLYPTNVGFVTPVEMNLIFYGYLGAYVFSVQQIVRRYNTFDLQPQAYASTLVRMITASVLIFAGGSIILTSGGQLAAGSSSATSATPQAWAAVLAFVIGAFPDRGIQWFSQIASRVLSAPSDQASERPLTKLLGISAWHVARLAEVGIDDAQNLAQCDIGKLLLTTQFDTHEIINWIDQAILYVKVGDRIDRFRDAHITTFHELYTLVPSLPARSTAVMGAAADAAQAEQHQALVTILGLTGPEDLQRLIDYSSFPNYTHIRAYHESKAKKTEQVVVANAGLQSLAQAFKQRKDPEDVLMALYASGQQTVEGIKGIIEDAQHMLRAYPKDPTIWLSIGIAHYQLEQLDLAHEAYERALAIDSELPDAYYFIALIDFDRGLYDNAIHDCTQAIDLDSYHARAFNMRGLAHWYKGYPDLASDDFDRALQLDDHLAVAYYNRGVISNVPERVASAVRDFERAYLLDYREDAGLWISWGEALLNLQSYGAAIEKLSKAIMLGDAEIVGRAYAYRAKAYAQQGEGFMPQSKLDYEAAIKHYTEALNRDATNYVTRYNLALAYLQVNRVTEAQKQFEMVSKSGPVDSLEVKEALAWLSRERGVTNGVAMEHSSS